MRRLETPFPKWKGASGWMRTRDLPAFPTQVGLNGYPAPQPVELTRRLAALYGVSMDQLLVTRGSDEAVDLSRACLLPAFTRRGRHLPAHVRLLPRRRRGLYRVLVDEEPCKPGRRRAEPSPPTDAIESVCPCETMAKKVGEEGVEVAVSATSRDGRVVEEAADLLYHLLVLLTASGRRLSQVTEVLRERHRVGD